MGVIQVNISTDLFLEAMKLNTDPEAKDIDIVHVWMDEDDPWRVKVILSAEKFPNADKKADIIECTPVFHHQYEEIKVVKWGFEKENEDA